MEKTDLFEKIFYKLNAEQVYFISRKLNLENKKDLKLFDSGRVPSNIIPKKERTERICKKYEGISSKIAIKEIRALLK